MVMLWLIPAQIDVKKNGSDLTALILIPYASIIEKEQMTTAQ